MPMTECITPQTESTPGYGIHYKKQDKPKGSHSSPKNILGISTEGIPPTEVYKNPYPVPKNKDRVIYFSRHGESQFNNTGKIGGNASLSDNGGLYAKAIAANFAKFKDLKVWTSELIRTHETAEHFKVPKQTCPELNEINAGDHDGLTYEEIAHEYPVEFAKRDQDKLAYRYPNGESYVDVCKRLEPLLCLMNEENNLLVISHQAVLRCVLAFFIPIKDEEIPYVKVPLHTIVKMTWRDGKNELSFEKLPIACVDTHRQKPKKVDLNRSMSEALETVLGACNVS